MKELTVIIINYNTPEMTEKVIRTFQKMESGLDYEIILIDNNSSKKVGTNIINELGVKLIENKENLGFARAVNQGIEMSSSEYILLLNSDVLIEENSISKLISYMEENKKIGIIGPSFTYPDGRWQISTGRFPSFWREFSRLMLLYKILPIGTYIKETKEISEVDWMSGGCMLIRRELINDIRSLDGNYFFGVEDMDFCLRAKRNGWKVIYYPESRIIHYHGYSSGGTKSLFRVRTERDGIIYYFKKNHPEKILARKVLELIFNFKIFVFRVLGYR